MSDPVKQEASDEQISESRRAFLDKTRKAAVAAPAAALLLAATAAKSGVPSGQIIR